MNGWFVPVHTLLDYILAADGNRDITQHDRNRLERKWLRHKICDGIKSLLSTGREYQTTSTFAPRNCAKSAMPPYEV
jgi:hypothetical protein